MGKAYEKKVKLTRILLEDYLKLKGLAQMTGQSMAEALHTIITRDWAAARSVTKPVSQPAFPVTAPVAMRHKPPVALRHKPPVSIATNGNKAVVFRIKTKGVRHV